MKKGEANNSKYKRNVNSDHKTSNKSSKSSASILKHIPLNILTKKGYKKVFLLIGVAIICIVVTSIIILLSTQKPAAEEEIDPRSFEEIFWSTETTTEAIEIYQKKIDLTDNSKEKADLLNERADYLFQIYSSKDLYTDQILSDLEQSQEMSPSVDTAFTLYDYYNFFGDKEKSEHYKEIYEELSEDE